MDQLIVVEADRSDAVNIVRTHDHRVDVALGSSSLRRALHGDVGDPMEMLLDQIGSSVKKRKPPKTPYGQSGFLLALADFTDLGEDESVCFYALRISLAQQRERALTIGPKQCFDLGDDERVAFERGGVMCFLVPNRRPDVLGLDR
ncbi:MAG TPA: hypothetical protein VG244_10105 [Acidimicrobiales bacterium]|nr:hypothetical protein [Acidimicrobiales bacterium]